MRRTHIWYRRLEVVLVVVFGYALALVFAGPLVMPMFAALGFGPAEAIDTAQVRDYLRLPFMVLGALMAGWTLTLIQIVRGPLRDGSRWALRVIASSLGLWFVLDTGMSLALGYPSHALFNVPFGVALAIPLWQLRTT